MFIAAITSLKYIKDFPFSNATDHYLRNHKFIIIIILNYNRAIFLTLQLASSVVASAAP